MSVDIVNPETKAQRVAMLMDEKGMDVAEVMEITGVSDVTVYRWRNNESQPYDKYLRLISQKTGASYKWLKYGKGEMLQPGPKRSTGDGSAETLPAGAAGLLAKGESYFGEQDVLTLTVYRETDIRPGAGNGGFHCIGVDKTAIKLCLFKQFVHDLLGFWPPDDVEALRVLGTSMEPTFLDGQVILVRRTKQLREMINMRRYVISIRDEFTGDWMPQAKRIHRRAGGGFRIISDNRTLGEPDVVLLPAAKGKLKRAETEEKVLMCVFGEILWPRDGDRQQRVQAATETLETIFAEGMLQRPA